MANAQSEIYKSLDLQMKNTGKIVVRITSLNHSPCLLSPCTLTLPSQVPNSATPVKEEGGRGRVESGGGGASNGASHGGAGERGTLFVHCTLCTIHYTTAWPLLQG